MKQRNICLFMGAFGIFMICLGTILLINDNSFNGSDFENKLETNLKKPVVSSDNLEFSEDDSNKEMIAPAVDTKELIKTMNKLNNTFFDGDEIKFSKNIDILEGEKIAIWIYSKPKYLGVFEIVLEDGAKKIVGLSKALKKITIDSGEHNMAITTISGKEIGYIDIYVSDNGVVSGMEEEEIIKEDQFIDKPVIEEVPKTTIKEIIVSEELPFKVLSQKEINMLRGTKEIIQQGVLGLKEIKYNITYDENGKEISREKVSEKLVKKTVEQIETIGISDYNLNTDYIKGVMYGPVCTEDKTYIAEDGYKYCNDIDNELNSFFAIKINDYYYVSCLDSKECNTDSLVNVDNLFKISSLSPYVYSGNFNGTLYYFDAREISSREEKLTLDLCSKYRLSCGSW